MKNFDRYNLNLLIKGFDYFSPQEITDEIYNVDNLRLSLDFTKYSKKAKDSVIDEWMALLPKLKNVKNVLLMYPKNQEFFSAVCKMVQLESLFLSSLKVDDLAPLSNLRNINRLVIDSCHQLKRIYPITELKTIEYLTVENCFNIDDLELIGQMTGLKALCLTGDQFAPKRLRLPSLKPFSNLKQLKHLNLPATSIIDKSYDVILEMPELERFDITGSINPSVVDFIKSNHPSLKAGFFVDWDYANKKIYEGKEW